MRMETTTWLVVAVVHTGAAAAAAKSLQSCPTLCDPIDGSPPGLPIPGILQQEHWSGLPFPSAIRPAAEQLIMNRKGSDKLRMQFLVHFNFFEMFKTQKRAETTEQIPRGPPPPWSNGTPLQCSCLENPVDGGAW